MVEISAFAFEVFWFLFLTRWILVVVGHVAVLGLCRSLVWIRVNHVFSRQLSWKPFLPGWGVSRLTQAPASQLLPVFLSSGLTFGFLLSFKILWVSWKLPEAWGTPALSLGKLFWGLDFACRMYNQLIASCFRSRWSLEVPINIFSFSTIEWGLSALWGRNRCFLLFNDFQM